MSTMTKIVSIVSDLRPTFTTEDQLQAALAEALGDVFGHDNLERERPLDRLGRNRIDIYLLSPNNWQIPGNSIGIEVKIKGSAAAARRQLERYAREESIGQLILITTRASHAHMPTEMNGKPVTTILLLEAGL